jgi:hypothetical protein
MKTLLIACILSTIPALSFAEEYSKSDDYKMAISNTITSEFTLEEINAKIADFDDLIANCDAYKARYEADKQVWVKRKDEAVKLGVKEKLVEAVKEEVAEPIVEPIAEPIE